MNRKLSVCMIVHAYYIKDARVRRYAESLAKLGHDVDVICLNEGPEPKAERIEMVDIHRISLSRSRGGIMSYLVEYVTSFWKFVVAINKLTLSGEKYDLIHIHNFPNFLVFSVLIQKLLGSRIILDIHDPMPELFMSKFAVDRKHILIRLLRIEEKISLKFPDYVLVANKFFQDIIVSRGCSPAKTAVVLNTPDEKFYSRIDDILTYRRKKKYFDVLYIGTLAKRYGIEVLIDAVKKLHDTAKIPNLRLSIIPKLKEEGSYTQRLLETIDKLGLEGVFRMLEPVPHHEMLKVIRDADLSAYTPLPDVHMNIAMSLKIPESIAVGRPIVTSRLAVLEEYFGDDCLFIFEPGDVDDCAAKILEVYTQPAEVSARVMRAQKALMRYSWEKQLAIYLEVIQNILKE